MKLTIDSSVSVAVRPPSGDRAGSVTLSILGGSVWLPLSACPEGIREGLYKGADLDVSVRTVPVQNGARAVFVPVRLLCVR